MKKIISFNNIDPRKKVLVIGAGYSGLLLGLMLKEKKIPYLIVEKNSHPGGVWISQGNATSKVQIDPVAYAALSAATSIPPAYTPTEEITAEFKRIADGLDIAYNVNVQKITQEGELHRVQLLSGNHIDAAAVAIRTGTLTQPKEITYPNESIFNGTITYGIKIIFPQVILKEKMLSLWAWVHLQLKTCARHSKMVRNTLQLWPAI